MSPLAVVVPAAGIGKRMQSDIPKQYFTINGLTVLEHTLLQLHCHPHISQIHVVLHPEDDHFSTLPIANQDWIIPVKGGQERSDSVLAGIEAIHNAEWVLVHDAARPCINLEDISKLLALCSGKSGGILATPVRDTMKRGGHEGHIETTICRENLWHAQTPQLFSLDQLKSALKECKKQQLVVTDEASAIEQTGGVVKLVEGCHSNIKITHPEDLALAEFYINQQNRIYL